MAETLLRATARNRWGPDMTREKLRAVRRGRPEGGLVVLMGVLPRLMLLLLLLLLVLLLQLNNANAASANANAASASPAATAAAAVRTHSPVAMRVARSPTSTVHI